MPGKKKNPFGYGVYKYIHKLKTGGGASLSADVYGRDPLKAFETLGAKPGPLTKRLRRK